jgi:hypothetical protein
VVKNKETSDVWDAEQSRLEVLGKHTIAELTELAMWRVSNLTTWIGRRSMRAILVEEHSCHVDRVFA